MLLVPDIDGPELGFGYETSSGTENSKNIAHCSDKYISSEERDLQQFHPTKMCEDLLMFAAILVDTYHHPLHLMDPAPAVQLHTVPIYTDACPRDNFRPKQTFNPLQE